MHIFIPLRKCLAALLLVASGLMPYSTPRISLS